MTVTDDERADVQHLHQPHSFPDLGQGGDERYGSAHGVLDAGALVGKNSQLFVFGRFEIDTRPLPSQGSHGWPSGVGTFGRRYSPWQWLLSVLAHRSVPILLVR